MNIVIDKRVLRDFIENNLSEERSFHTKNIAEIPAKEDEEPIVPQTQMSVQLSTSEPPVGDPDFIPASVSELSLAAAVIARETPSTQIEFLYRNLHKLLDRALDREKERRTGQIVKDTGIVLNHDMIEIEKEMENDRQEMALREAVSRFLFEQGAMLSPEETESLSDAVQKTYGDSWEPEEDWEREQWKESEATGTEEKSIPRATDEIISYLKPIVGDKTVINPFSGTTGQKQRGGLETLSSLSTLLGPEKVDPVIAKIFSKYSLTPEQIKIVRYAVTQEMMKYKTHTHSKAMPTTPSGTDWSTAQLAANQVADQIALKMLKGRKDPQTGEWIAPPATQEDVAAELVRRSEAETDQNMINAYQEMAQMILSKSGAAEELRARREAEREVRELQAQEAKAEEVSSGPPKDLSDLWTQIAKEEGFASAAGARQFAFKPMIKYYLESMAIPPEVMEAIKGRSLQTFKRGMRSFNLGLDRDQINQIVRSSRIAPEMSGDQFRTYFKLIFFQPFVNDFLKVWKSQVGVMLSEMGIQDPKQVFTKMLVGETSPNSKSAKAKIASAMTPIQFSQALERARAWSSNPANSAALAQKYAQRIEEPAKVKNSIQKALSNPDI